MPALNNWTKLTEYYRILVSFAAVFRLVTQRSSPQTAAFFRTTFLSLCLSVQAIDQSYHSDCLQSNQSNCSKKTFPRIFELRIWDVHQRKSVRSFYSSVFELRLTTVFVDTRLRKTKHPWKRFQNFRQSCPDALGKLLFILRKNLSPVALDKCAR